MFSGSADRFTVSYMSYVFEEMYPEMIFQKIVSANIYFNSSPYPLSDFTYVLNN